MLFSRWSLIGCMGLCSILGREVVMGTNGLEGGVMRCWLAVYWLRIYLFYLETTIWA